MSTNPTGSILVRRGPTNDRMAFCPLQGELVYDTTTNMFYIGDGVTYGGVSIVQRTYPSRGVMIKGTTSETFLVAPGDINGADYQFLVYNKATGQYNFSTITTSGVALTRLKVTGANGLLVTRTDTSPTQSNPTVTTVADITVDVDPVPFKTYISLQNVTNESKATMFTSPTFTGHATIEGQTLTGVTGTGKLVLDNSPTISGHATIEGQTLTGVTGTGNLVLGASPTISGTLTLSSNVTSSDTTHGSLVVAGGVGISGSTFIGGDLQVTGNISFNGAANQLSATQLNIDDPMIYLAYNNTADTIDTGILAAYNDGAHKHAGLARDHTDNTWKFFTNLTNEPGSTVSWANVTYAPVKMGALTATTSNFTGNMTVTGGTITGTLAKTFTINGIAFNGSADVTATVATGPQGPQGPSTYDLFNFINGKPLALEVLMRAITVRVYTIAANFAGCLAYCTTGATTAQTINILKNGATIGTITFAIGSTSGVFAGSVSGVTMNIGDQLQLQMASGASQDASFSDLAFTIKGTSS